MSIEQIRVDATSATISRIVRIDRREGPLQKQMRSIAIAEPGPQIDFPCQTPAGANIAAQFQAFPRGGEKLGTTFRSNLVAGEQSIEVRYMTMLSLRRFQIPIVKPLLQLPGFANLHWSQARAHCRQLRPELL